MHQERWLPFLPEECLETVWEQLSESGRREVVEIYARLMARAASCRPATAATARTTQTTTQREEASRDQRDS
jgi:hypothetical protein